MSKFNFNSKPCTSREQSKRLLALGIKKETADCGHFYGRQEHELYEDWETVILDDSWEPYWDVTDEDIPAWSLYRLLEMMPTSIKGFYTFSLIYDIRDNAIGYVSANGVSIQSFRGINIFDNIIFTIEWLIKEGYFNKEYLV